MIDTPQETRITWLRDEIDRYRQNTRLFHADHARRAEAARMWLRRRRELRFYLAQANAHMAYRARVIAGLTPKHLLIGLREHALSPAEYSAAMTALCARRGLRGPGAE
jgi:hypothetical protein